jgi:aminoacylase
VEPSEIGAMLDQWCKDCSCDPSKPTVSWSYISEAGNDLQKHSTTSTDASNPWYRVFEDAISAMGMKMEPRVFPAATDSRFLRALGIRALGFSPMRHTEIMLHEIDEYIPEATYLEGISVFVNLIQALGSQGKALEGN